MISRTAYTCALVVVACAAFVEFFPNVYKTSDRTTFKLPDYHPNTNASESDYDRFFSQMYLNQSESEEDAENVDVHGQIDEDGVRLAVRHGMFIVGIFVVAFWMYDVVLLLDRSIAGRMENGRDANEEPMVVFLANAN